MAHHERHRNLTLAPSLGMITNCDCGECLRRLGRCPKPRQDAVLHLLKGKIP